MKTPPEHQDPGPVLGATIRPVRTSADGIWEHVEGDVWRNTRTGQVETRQKLPRSAPSRSAPIWPVGHLDDEGKD